MVQFSRVVKWLVVVLFVSGMIGALPPGVAAQDTGSQDVPTEAPANPPTEVPTSPPTDIPTAPPTEVPPAVPTESPTETPADPATEVPTASPTEVPATETPPADQAGSPEASLRVEALLVNGTVVVLVQDAAGNPLPGACLSVNEDAGNGALGWEVAFQCDGVEDGVNDGQLVFSLPPGAYVLIEEFAPEGYISGGRTSFSLAEGAQLQLTVTNMPGGVVVQVFTEDENGTSLGGACYAIFEDAGGGQAGDFVSANCDDVGDGLTWFQGIAPGSYVAVETWEPDGYVSTGDTPFIVPAGNPGPVDVTVVNIPLASPGHLVVHTVDEIGEPLPGACFDVFVDTGGGIPGDHVSGLCDFSTGTNDGTTTITGLAPGNYVLVESFAPTGYIVGDSRPVSISASTATVTTVQNVPGGVTLTVNLVDASGNPLPGSCFGVWKVVPDGTAFVTGDCDDIGPGTNDGAIILPGLTPGNYVLVETFTPPGHALAADVAFTVGNPASDLVIDVENVAESATDALIRRLIEILIEILESILA